MKSFFSALALITIIPVPQRWTKNLSTCSVYFPLAGLLLGFFYWLAAKTFMALNVSPDFLGLVLLSTMVILTRGLHLDGLADTADGFWGGQDKNGILRIMKDSSIGVYGALALILLLAFKWAALKSLGADNAFFVLLTAALISRFEMTLLSGLFRYPRETGTGQSVITKTFTGQVLISFFYCLALSFAICGYAGILALLLGSFTALLIGFWSFQKIGGVTGDVLGFTCEITEMILLWSTPVLLSVISPQAGNFIWKLLAGLQF